MAGLVCGEKQLPFSSSERLCFCLRTGVVVGFVHGTELMGGRVGLFCGFPGWLLSVEEQVLASIKNTQLPSWLSQPPKCLFLQETKATRS